MTSIATTVLCQALGSTGEVDDLVQETYLRALGAMPRFCGEAPIRVWLLSIARRVCADHVRRRQRRRRLDERLSRQLGPTFVAAPAVVGCPVGTIRSRVVRARDDLTAVVTRAAAS